MLNQQIVDYIKIQKNTGGTKESITNGLVVGGFKIEDIEEAFKSLDGNVEQVSISPNYSKGLVKTLIYTQSAIFISLLIVFIVVATGPKSTGLDSGVGGMIMSLFLSGLFFVSCVVGMIYSLIKIRKFKKSEIEIPRDLKIEKYVSMFVVIGSLFSEILLRFIFVFISFIR